MQEFRESRLSVKVNAMRIGVAERERESVPGSNWSKLASLVIKRVSPTMWCCGGIVQGPLDSTSWGKEGRKEESSTHTHKLTIYDY